MTYENSHSEGRDAAAIDPPSVVFGAFIQALKVCLLRFFTIPWSIWWGAALRLVELGDRSQTDVDAAKRSEFPVYEWSRGSFDGAIFLAWFIAGFLSVFGFLGGLLSGNSGLFGATGILLSGLLSGYFSVIVLSLLKESTLVIFSIALNIEKLRG